MIDTHYFVTLIEKHYKKDDRKIIRDKWSYYYDYRNSEMYEWTDKYFISLCDYLLNCVKGEA